MADPLNGPAAFTAPSYLQAIRSASTMSANKFDEGYSEDTRSQTGSDMIMRGGEGAIEADLQYGLPEWVVGMTESERSEFAYAILRSLRTSSIAGIVDKLNPLLHLDPVMHLPPEITFQIFSYLTPETLLRSSILSQSWRIRAADSSLWKLMFRLEGWNSNFGVVRAFEERERQKRTELRDRERKRRVRATTDTDTEKPSSKKRVRERPLFGDGPPENGIHNKLEPLTLNSAQDATSGWGEQHSVVEADDVSSTKPDDSMEGIAYEDTPSISSPTLEGSRRRKRSSDPGDDESSFTSTSTSTSHPFRPSIFLPTDEPKINWQYLYKQKRRLEDNWDNGRFVNFQLPHPKHAEQSHTECVYTIQYSGKYLVSGSRDKTVRVWDLDTQQLVLPPLVGHHASVLCLQFDERPEQDLIVSGGSDCSFILWKFSTGRMIKRVEKAHQESVLNLKFDDTYLVTCSKDKTIKVWNRKELWPTDDAYPSSTKKSKARFPSYIIDMQHQVENQHLHFKPLPPNSLIMTIEGHAAAVNAIQILNGQIVSASGDRNVRVWDVRTGFCIRTFSGHTKGIACVQFDGRRIVSGSSDETVRIFDHATAAEIACLHGHSSLVRTVQAQFADLPGNEEDLEAEAKAVDQNFFAEAQRQGYLDQKSSRESRRSRNAGSRDPSSILAFGAKLPPGGGGSRWARIVSGSYDETVIIWKKGADGSWEKAKVLYQSEAVRAAGGRPRRPVAHANGPPNAGNQAQNQTQQQNQTPQQNQGGQAQPWQAFAIQAAASVQAAQTLAQQAQALHTASQAFQPNTGSAAAAATTSSNAAASSSQTAAQAQPSTATPAPQQNAAAATGGNNTNATAAAAHHHHHAAPHHHHHAAPNHAGGVNAQGTSRVFKLQFDARRIVCCSQDPTIVGWDFANNDKDIMMASQFFGNSV